MAKAEIVQDHTKVIIERFPYTVEVCTEQATSADKSGDMLKGAIIGGLIGNNIKGEKDGGAIGAVIGGILGHANSDATGDSKVVCVNETRYEESERTVYSHSTVTFKHEGKTYTLRFIK